MLYEFNEQTGEYIMEMPFETQKTSNRTDIKPPKTKETEVAVFNRELQEWETFKDYRFTHKMMKFENNNALIETIENFGEIPEGWTLITNEQAEEIKARQKIETLTMTPLDFIGVLQGYGLSLLQINAFLESNLEAKIQLTYCNLVYCGVAKKLMPITVEDITITPEMVEQAFIDKNPSVFEVENEIITNEE